MLLNLSYLGGQKQVVAHISDSELEEIINLSKFKEELTFVISNLKENFLRNISLRTNMGEYFKLFTWSSSSFFNLIILICYDDYFIYYENFWVTSLILVCICY